MNDEFKAQNIPAFPRPAGDYNGSRHGNSAQTGMTLRDYFAAKAMQGWQSNPVPNDTPIQDVAAWSYRMADAMLKAREA
jgi:hypothetical protein